MQLYAITDRKQYPTEGALLDHASAWAEGGVDFIQLREKDLEASQLEALARQMMQRLRGSCSRLLVNTAQAAVGLAAEAGGVHLAGRPVPGAAQRVRQIFPDAVISMPCHTLEELDMAVTERADILLFSPVFGKGEAPGQGLDALHLACAAARDIPVFALGGVTVARAEACVAAGAAGVAGIRLFAGDDWQHLRACPRHPRGSDPANDI